MIDMGDPKTSRGEFRGGASPQNRVTLTVSTGPGSRAGVRPRSSTAVGDSAATSSFDTVDPKTNRGGIRGSKAPSQGDPDPCLGPRIKSACLSSQREPLSFVFGILYVERATIRAA